MSDSEDPIDIADDGADDLFGDGEDESDNERPLSDHELDEDDEEEQHDRHRGDDDEGGDRQIDKTTMVMDFEVHRHRIPKPQDGKLRTLKVPDFLKLVPEEYKDDSYEPDAWDLEEDKNKYPSRAIRFRRNAGTGKLESNAVIYRWSDGSTTLAVGDQHFEIDVKKLAPPEKSYNEKLDSNYYAAAANLHSNSLLTVGHITEEFKVRPNAALEAAALDRLTEKMDAANKRRHPDSDIIFRSTEDPETMRKQAELAEKERERARRRRENAAARLDGSTGVGGGRYARGGGLSIGGLESGGGGGGGGGRRKGPGQPRQKRRRDDYDSDDDPGPRRQDNYDMGDEFIAPSDEEISEEADDDDEEELLDDEEEEEAPRSKRRKTAESPAEEEDADGEADDDAPAAHAEQSGRRGRRHIVDDDDE